MRAETIQDYLWIEIDSVLNLRDLVRILLSWSIYSNVLFRSGWEISEFWLTSLFLKL